MHSNSNFIAANSGRVPAVGILHRNRRQLLRKFAYVTMWLLPIMTFTTPVQQTASNWEVLDLAKLAILAFSCFGGAFVIQLQLGNPDFRKIIDPLIPFFAFFGYAIISIAWSPLRSVTLAQAGSLVALLMFSASIALLSSHRDEVSSVLKSLNWMLIAFSAFVFGFYLWNPEASGLDRSRIHSGGDGIVHPTASGATASLGLLLPILCYKIGKFGWAKRLILPSIIFHGTILFFSNSRLATGLALFILGGLLFWHSSNLKRALFIAFLGLFSVLILVIDPGFTILESAGGVGAQYVSRGQSSDQLMGVSGRSEMWTAIWGEYTKAMMFGHGYFVTSERGELLVWNEWQNHTAHNLVLQILVSTGALGLVIFLYGLIQPAFYCLPLCLSDERHKGLFKIFAVLSVWFFGWSLLGISFMGSIRPESVVFFSMLGIGIGQASKLDYLRPFFGPKHNPAHLH